MDMNDEMKPFNYPVGTHVRKYEFFVGRQWVDGEVIEPECDDFYTVRYSDGDVEEYTGAELDRLVQWKSLKVGSRIRVQLPCEKEKTWKVGVIEKFRPQRRKAFQIRFERSDADSADSTLRWLSFLEEDFEILPESPARTKVAKSKSPVSSDHFQQKRQAIKVGDRLEFKGDNDGMYYPGTVTQHKKGQYFFECDDGDKGWVDFGKTAYRHLSSESDNVSANQNLEKTILKNKKRRRSENVDSIDSAAVNDENDVEVLENSEVGSSYPLVNRKMRPASKSKRHRRKTCSGAESSAEDVVSLVGESEKEDVIVDIEVDESEVDEGPRQNRRQTGAEELIIPEADPVQPAEKRKETCLLCRASVMTKPRATPCHHLFCKACIEKHMEKDRSCPQCHFSSKDFQLRDEISSPISFRQVECIDKLTGEVREVFSSASCASTTGGRSAIRIIDACHSKQRDDREHRGYYWRFHGSKDRILRTGEGVIDGFAVEQICLKTGKVLACYPSVRKAQEKTGICKTTIKRVVEQRGKANGGGFFWRYCGDNHVPWKDPLSVNSKAVEQLDLTSGEVIREFECLAAAKKALGLKRNSGCIRDTCEGKRLSAFGFFWRWKGSQNPPKRESKHGKRVLLRSVVGGPVVREFANARMAANSFFIDFSAVCRWCREESSGAGYIWSYAPESNGTPDENAKLVSKRIRVLRPATDEWMEGKLIAYNPVTGKHTIKYDSGEAVLVNLNDFEYDLKNDPGRKPVEKLSVETGEVLQTFPSVSEAAQDIGLKEGNYSGISAVLHGTSRLCRGFFYRYQGSQALPRQSVKSKRAVEQLCLKTGRVLATFDSIQDAGKVVGITTPGISYCCNGRNGAMSAGGFGWRFADRQLN